MRIVMNINTVSLYDRMVFFYFNVVKNNMENDVM